MPKDCALFDYLRAYANFKFNLGIDCKSHRDPNYNKIYDCKYLNVENFPFNRGYINGNILSFINLFEQLNCYDCTSHYHSYQNEGENWYELNIQNLGDRSIYLRCHNIDNDLANSFISASIKDLKDFLQKYNNEYIKIYRLDESHYFFNERQTIELIKRYNLFQTKIKKYFQNSNLFVFIPNTASNIVEEMIDKNIFIKRIDNSIYQQLHRFPDYENDLENKANKVYEEVFKGLNLIYE